MIKGRKLISTLKILTAVSIDTNMPYYAVRRGIHPGIYLTWPECKVQVDNFQGARYKKFDTEKEAMDFVYSLDSPVKGTKYQKYAKTPAKSPRRQFTKSPTMTHATSFAAPSPVQENSTELNEDVLNKSAKLKLVEQEIECLKAKLKLKEAEKEVLQTQRDLEELKQHCGATGKAPTTRSKLHKVKPYQKSPSSILSSPPLPSSSISTANSSNWSQNRVTRLLDLDSIRELHTSTSPEPDCEDDSVPVVYTDGACINNGTVQARAGIGVYWGPGHTLNVSERLSGRQTNNRAEIMAVVRAVLQSKEQGLEEITIKTDSQFLINSFTKWLPGWKRNGWKTSTGAPVINREDFEALEDAAQGIKINWVHVRGHKGIAGNEAADKLANDGANKGQRVARDGK